MLLLLVVSCPRKRPKRPLGTLKRANWSELGLFSDDMAFRNLARACRGSLEYYSRVPKDRIFKYGRWKVTAAQETSSLRAFLDIVERPGLSPKERTVLIEESFDLYESTGSDGRGTVLFTGYYEPLLEGRLKRGGEYRFPIYKRPSNLLTIPLSLFPLSGSSTTLYGMVEGGRVVPYYTREQIDEEGVLAGRGLELAWFRDPVDVFFLQIQGSGKVDLGGGRSVRVQYDGKNGRPYVSLGRYLVEKGLMEKDKVSMRRIRDFLARHPAGRQALLNVNPSYSFFRLESDGPFGNISVVLTPYRSIATDSSIFPKGAPCLIKTEKPLLDAGGRVMAWTPFTRFVLNQDTGGAIKGPGRADLFCGGGSEAETTAGNMRCRGRLYFLLEKGILKSPLHEED